MRKFILRLLTKSIWRLRPRICIYRLAQVVVWLYGYLLCISPMLVIVLLLKKHPAALPFFLFPLVGLTALNFYIIVADKKGRIPVFFESLCVKASACKDEIAYKAQIRALLNAAASRKLNALEYAAVRTFLQDLNITPAECGVHCEHAILEEDAVKKEGQISVFDE